MDMPRYPDDLLDRIRQGVDLVELISEHVPLTKKGRNYVSLCPFHTEKTPSFSVNPDRGIYHCFGCGAGGDAFRFLMEVERISFGEAVRILAGRAGVPLPTSGRSSKVDEANDELYRANELAKKYFSYLLTREEGRRAWDYLTRRGVSSGIIERFQLGYSPSQWDAFSQVAAKRGFSGEVLERAGLCIRRQSGGVYDRFRDRVMFPITGVSGRVIAFGARALSPDAEPKYINSPETPIYKKGATLYGLSQAKEAIRREGTVLIVEGYMDLLRLVQSGIEHGVASSGTAFTPDHARILSRYAERVVIVYDGDPAGTSASFRSLDILLAEGLSPYVAVLPEGHDPDTYILAEGVEAFRRIVEGAQSLVQYRITTLTASGLLQTVEGKHRVVAGLAETAAKVRDEVKRALIVREIADGLGLDETVIARAVAGQMGRRRGRQPSSEEREEKASTLSEPMEFGELIAVMLKRPDVVGRVVDLLRPEDLQEGPCRQIIEAIFDCHRRGKRVEPALLIDRFVDNPSIAGLVARLAGEGFNEAKVDRIVTDHITTMKERSLGEEIRRIEDRLREVNKGGVDEEVTTLLRRHAELTAERERLKATTRDRRWE
jgi:DNA primase